MVRAKSAHGQFSETKAGVAAIIQTMLNLHDDHLECRSRLDAQRRIPWLIVVLLVPVALLNYLDRQMLAAMKSSMMSDIPDIATRANWGLVLGSFKWVYALLSPM